MTTRYLIIGGGIVAAVAVYMFNQLSAQRRGKTFPVNKQTNKPPVQRQSPNASKPVRQSPKPQKAYDSAFMQDLDQTIQRFRHDSLAYFIYEAANKQGLSTSAIEKLFEQYGRCPTNPLFLPYLQDKMESDHRFVPAVSDWLKQKGIESPSSRWDKAIENYVWSSTKTEANEIVSALKNGTASSE